ncbi:MAG: hypothetical protein KJ720_06295 [Proteobacteria bacterium]|nr:hypothetical protein [Pseudomonadota bacterium]MBU1451758.1 hypothetical protein [Pseudomonadota bacterium]MBU2468165.1 hypothetical protein [Pseudomonadota bacterium]MBU2516960.1 hypothetical protein [Pseudomonadota bacterium]
MRRTLLALVVLLLSAAPAAAWPPTLKEFQGLAIQAAPPGWKLSDSASLRTAGSCAPQLMVIFKDSGAYLEYRLDMDNPEMESDEGEGKKTRLEGRAAMYLQAGDWPRFTYLTVFLPAQAASLTIGVNQDYTLQEMSQIFYAFPLDKLIAPPAPAR